MFNLKENIVMIKGVNKKIVEINRTGNEYIEKAILILNPKMECEDKNFIRKNAEDFLSLAAENNYIYNKKYKRIAICLAVISLSLLALLIVILVAIIL